MHKGGQCRPESTSPVTDQWMVSPGIRGGHKIRPARRLDRFLINLGHDRTNSVIWLSFYFIRTHCQIFKFQIVFIPNSTFKIQNDSY